MQNLENDMDDLFQRAAENFYLKEANSEWESIRRRIADKQETKGFYSPQPGRTKQRSLMIFLFFFIVIADGFMFYPLNKMHSDMNYDNSFRQVHRDKVERDASKEVLNISNKKFDPILLEKFKSVKNQKSKRFTKNVDPGKRFENIDQKRMLAGTDKSLLIYPMGKNQYYNQVNEKLSNELLETELINKPEMFLESNCKSRIELKDELKIKIEKSTLTTPQGSDKIKKTYTGGFYIGLLTGPDFSKVKSMPFQKGGYSTGIIIGFAVSDKLSFETGFFQAKKKYTSEGNEFSLDKVRTSMPSDMIINNLESESKLKEIPFKIKYNFINKKNAAFFVSAGASAYIIKSEKNMYYVSHNGIQEKVFAAYQEKNFKLPAVAGISMGYQRTVSHKIDIRVEPFIKVPLQGIGIGSLPVTSAGLHAGMTYRLK